VKVKENFGEPARFGKLVLPFDPTADAVTGRALAGDRLFYGSGRAPFEVVNKRDQPVRVRLAVHAQTAAGMLLLGEARQSVGAASSRQIRVKCAFARAGPVRLRYQLFEEPRAKLLYTTSREHTVPEPLAVHMSSLVSYVSEKRLVGSWVLGLSHEAAAGATLVVEVRPRGHQKVLVRVIVSPRTESGSFVLAVGALPPGAYALRVQLKRGERTLGQKTFSLDRIRGPLGALAP